ncbi:hypothetical protein RRG08_039869 [Elysia crispata]|uniref:THD domain-containing protein n=1 Tax=Elysia crispata TaxID=231223 RepID=A0AAE1DNE8_9GAST|nr:hypothetical protein RRG08_039869 [Elysia crispata]
MKQTVDRLTNHSHNIFQPGRLPFSEGVRVSLKVILNLRIDSSFVYYRTVNIHPHVVTNSGSGVATPRPAAHFMMPRIDKSKIINVRGKEYEIEKWLYTGDMAFTTGGAYHQYGRIVVPTDGYYYVYSQISFLETLSRNEDRSKRYRERSPSLSVYLYRYNMLYTKGGEEKLAQNSITKCWGQSKLIEEYTSSLGAVFFLRQKDEIFIKVSNLTVILDDPKSSFFGFFRI